MFVPKIRFNSTPFGSESLKHCLGQYYYANLEPKLFLNKLSKEFDNLTPSEIVSASKHLDKLVQNTTEPSFSSDHVSELKRQLINNVRSKLYSLSDLEELCNITIGISNSGILTKSYVLDFLSRFDKLVVGINFHCVPAICNSLILLHINGHRVDGVCIKFYNVLVSDNIIDKLDNLSLVKLFECYISLNIKNGSMEKKIVSEIKQRLSLNTIPTHVLISLVERNDFRRSKLYFINSLLIAAILKDGQIQLADLVSCLNSCKDLRHSFDRVDQLWEANEDDLAIGLKLDLLDNFARFKYKPFYLNDMLDDASSHLSQLDFEHVLRLFKNIYELNVYNTAIVEAFSDSISGIHDWEYNKLYCDALVAMRYFSVADVGLYNSLLYEIIRNEYKLNEGDKIKLQIFYTMLRCDHGNDQLIDFIDSDVKNFLANLTEYYEVKNSSHSKYVSDLVRTLSHTIYERVNIGGFYLDFIRPHRRDGANFVPIEHGVAVLIDECYATSPSQAYRSDSGYAQPKADTKGKEECSKYILMKNILNKLNVKYVCVSVDALRELSPKHQLEYIKRLIAKHTS